MGKPVDDLVEQLFGGVAEVLAGVDKVGRGLDRAGELADRATRPEAIERAVKRGAVAAGCALLEELEHGPGSDPPPRPAPSAAAPPASPRQPRTRARGPRKKARDIR